MKPIRIEMYSGGALWRVLEKFTMRQLRELAAQAGSRTTGRKSQIIHGICRASRRTVVEISLPTARTPPAGCGKGRSDGAIQA